MKVVILAGGLGTRLSEETSLIPKPMVEIGGRPILWHIMKFYSHWGFNEFVVLTGYKSHIIKDFFINYYTRYSDITVDMAQNTVEIHKHRGEDWKVTLLYTGADTETGGRLLMARETIGNERFMLTYGDGVGDVNIPALLLHHEKSGKTATLTAVRPPGRFGELLIDDDDAVRSFHEKPGGLWVSGGFFVLENAVFDYIEAAAPADTAHVSFERAPLERLARDGRLSAYKHAGFWRPMDTLRDRNELTELWQNNKASWAVWMK
jgi:glucose-1-phosphate cytidylyltransferase